MEFELLESVCTITASHEFAAIVTGLLWNGQSKNEPIATKNTASQTASNPNKRAPKKQAVKQIFSPKRQVKEVASETPLASSAV